MLEVVVDGLGVAVVMGVGDFGEYTNAGAEAENTGVFGLNLRASLLRM